MGRGVTIKRESEPVVEGVRATVEEREMYNTGVRQDRNQPFAES
jgi:hypothetical protein